MSGNQQRIKVNLVTEDDKPQRYDLADCHRVSRSDGAWGTINMALIVPLTVNLQCNTLLRRYPLPGFP
jgi:hypothetical protein